jgi:Carboxypeptidase regulatory-like domain/TonB-dependent Receptor Plug Domain/TonB dependent receptor
MSEWEVKFSSPAPHHSPLKRRVGASRLRYFHRDTFPAYIVWFALLSLLIAPTMLEAQDIVAHGGAADPQDHPLATGGKASGIQLSGTVIDASGALIPGATIVVRSADGTVQRTTQTDSNGSFTFSRLSAGNYRLVVSNPHFGTKEIPVTIGTTGAPAPLRISMAVNAVSTTINVRGRQDDLVGIASSAGQVTVGAEELKNRPLLRSGEILEALPGLIITQHAGGGKANQYFLRGFNLDHGTDFAIFLDGMPLNLPSHAHGEGYSDMNTVIPEFVERVNAEKGPYYADVGDYGSAGNAQVVFYKTLPRNFFQIDGGMYQFARFVFGVSQKLGKGNLLYGGEAYHDGGPWVHSDNYYKFNGLVTYIQGTEANGFSITTHAYDGARWNSSDQLPYTAVPVVGLFGSLSPSDGGRSQRYSLQGEWHHKSASSETQLMAYGFYYDLNLFSDFTYYLVDPYKGDQFEQQDRRWVAGFDLRHMIFGHFFGHKTETTFGMQLRNDWIHNGLFRTEDRVRTDKTFYTANYLDVPSPLDQVAVLPAATDLNKFTETIISPWVTTKIHWAERLRSVLALRGDDGEGVITSFTNPTNPNYPNDPYPANFNPNTRQSINKFLPSPKASLIFDPWANTELYVQGGFSYHTNDVRGSTQLYEPVSPDYPYYNTPNPIKIPFLVETKGGEVGVRTAAVPQLQSSVEVWYLHSNSELLQDGDTGGTSASVQSSNRYGIEVGNYYTPTQHLVFDADFADSRAIFTQNDADDSTFYTSTPTGPQLCARNSNCFGLIPNGGGTYLQNPYGKEVPEAVRWVVAAGAALQDYKRFSASLRLRYFGPRPLTSDAIYTSPSTALVNVGASYKINEHWSLWGEVLNLLNRRDHDVDYAYVSQITPPAGLGLPATPPTTLAGQEQVASVVNANAAFTRVMHPVEPVQARFTLRFSFGR